MKDRKDYVSAPSQSVGIRWMFPRQTHTAWFKGLSILESLSYPKTPLSVALWWIDCQVPAKAALLLPSVVQGRENWTKTSWVKTRTGKDHSPIIVLRKADTSWGNSLISYQSTWSRIMRKKNNQILKTPPFLLSGPNFCYGLSPVAK